MKKGLNRDFSESMVNLENSGHYHLFSSDLFITLERSLLNLFGDSLGYPLNESSIEKSINFMINLSKPDLKFPMIGDGSKQGLNDIKKLSFYEYTKEYAPLKWCLTKGETGEKPQDLFKVYKNEGYAFFRNSWDIKRKDKIDYVSFRSGYSVKYHKHGDDLSFTLFAKGKDIFVDSGTYTYEPGDFRRFFMSSLAHNTLVVDDQNYPFIVGDNNDTGIIDFGLKEDYYYVVGKNDMYNGVNLTRTLYYLKNGGIILIDNIFSYKEHEYSQYYHLSPQIKIEDIDIKFEEDNIKLKISDKDVKINIFQLNKCKINIIKGNKDKASPGIISEGFGDLQETNSLKFTIRAKKAQFITFIDVNNNFDEIKKKIQIDMSNSKNKEGELVINDFQNQIRIPIINYSRDIKHDLIIQKEDTTLFSFNITGTEEDESFAWYILENGKKVDVIWYDSNPRLKYLFNKPGEYQIQYFIKKGDDKKMITFPEKIIISKEDIVKSKIKFIGCETDEKQ